MKQLNFFTLFIFFTIAGIGQSEEPLTIYKCKIQEGNVYSILEQPKLKLKKSQLEKILNNSLLIPKLKKDSILYIYIRVTVDCDSSAEYSFFPWPNVKTDSVLALKMMPVLQNVCTWKSGIYNVENKKNIPRKVNGKIVFLPQYVYWFTKAPIFLKFYIKKGEIYLE